MKLIQFLKMKPILILGILILSYLTGYEQSLGIGTTNPNSSALLDLNSNSKGILIPRTSTSGRTAIVNPAKGLLLYDTTLSSFWFHNGNIWLPVSNTTSTNTPSLIVWSRETIGGVQEVWKADVDGNGQQKINIIMPSNYILQVNGDGGQVKITSDSQKLIFKGYNSSTGIYSLFSCLINGTNVVKLIDNIGTSFDVN